MNGNLAIQFFIKTTKKNHRFAMTAQKKRNSNNYRSYLPKLIDFQCKNAFLEHSPTQNQKLAP